MEKEMKSKPIAIILVLVGFLGVAGLHRFYLKKYGTGLLWLFTVGFMGFGTLIDLFTVGEMVDGVNTKEELKTIRLKQLGGL